MDTLEQKLRQLRVAVDTILLGGNASQARQAVAFDEAERMAFWSTIVGDARSAKTLPVDGGPSRIADEIGDALGVPICAFLGESSGPVEAYLAVARMLEGPFRGLRHGDDSVFWFGVASQEVEGGIPSLTKRARVDAAFQALAPATAVAPVARSGEVSGTLPALSQLEGDVSPMEPTALPWLLSPDGVVAAFESQRSHSSDWRYLANALRPIIVAGDRGWRAYPVRYVDHWAASRSVGDWTVSDGFALGSAVFLVTADHVVIAQVRSPMVASNARTLSASVSGAVSWQTMVLEPGRTATGLIDSAKAAALDELEQELGLNRSLVSLQLLSLEPNPPRGLLLDIVSFARLPLTFVEFARAHDATRSVLAGSYETGLPQETQSTADSPRCPPFVPVKLDAVTRIGVHGNLAEPDILYATAHEGTTVLNRGCCCASALRSLRFTQSTLASLNALRRAHLIA